ncbi:ATP-binding cassette sub-family E member 1 [Gigaspora margarita]|uniref:ATP-binding cassette sub-family E member 1 n=1 Tax=Gigaspora margarita TaxID=4874 RepID=A0A8H4A333_GIGMA|nr:ATP-binding cassette sub-family E member 1 [Gigaspora margarita]
MARKILTFICVDTVAHYGTVSRLGVELPGNRKSNYFKYLQGLRGIKEKEAIRLKNLFIMNFKKRECGYGTDSENETEKVDDDSDDWGEIANFKDFYFDEWIDTCSGKRWRLNNGSTFHQLLICHQSLMEECTHDMFDEPSSYLDVKQRLNAASTIRSLLQPDLLISSMYFMDAFFFCEGINIFLDGKVPTENLRFREESLKLKERPDYDKHHQVLKIYYYLIDMLLENPYSFINKKGEKNNLTEIEYIMKVSGPILDIIFSNNYTLS